MRPLLVFLAGNWFKLALLVLGAAVVWELDARRYEMSSVDDHAGVVTLDTHTGHTVWHSLYYMQKEGL